MKKNKIILALVVFIVSIFKLNSFNLKHSPLTNKEDNNDVYLHVTMYGYSDINNSPPLVYIVGLSLYYETSPGIPLYKQKWEGQIGAVTAGFKSIASCYVNPSLISINNYYFILFYITDFTSGYSRNINAKNGSTCYSFKYQPKNIPSEVDINAYFWGTTIYPESDIYVST